MWEADNRQRSPGIAEKAGGAVRVTGPVANVRRRGLRLAADPDDQPADFYSHPSCWMIWMSSSGL